MIQKRLVLLMTFFISVWIEASDYLDEYVFRTGVSHNIFGSAGLITIPSGQLSNEGNLNIIYSKNDIFKFGALTVNPFNWLEATYFYYRPYDVVWGSKKGSYLDKGFNLKVRIFSNKNSTIAMGLDDFAGTGVFAKEYLVATHKLNNIYFTGGIGWGNFANFNSFRNPIGYFIDEFKNRNSKFEKFGGNPSPDSWFRGNASLFAGIELFLPNYPLSLKLETNPFNYASGFSAAVLGSNEVLPGINRNLRKRDSDYNFGINYKLTENFNLSLASLNGNKLIFSFSINTNFSKDIVKKSLSKPELQSSQKGVSPKDKFYEDLIFNINKRNVFLQTAEIENDNLSVAISSSKYRNPIHIHAIVGETALDIANKSGIRLYTISSIGVNVGHELHRLTTPLPFFYNRTDTPVELVAKASIIQEGKGENYKDFEFRPIIKYPAIFSGISPALVNHIGDPVQFYYGGLVLRFDNEIQFSSKLQLNTEIVQNIANNFDRKRNSPDSRLPNVRTNIVDYLQSSDTYISRMQFDYFFKPYDEIFGKFSAGILENMYAGSGLELLYKPFHRDFSLGFELYKVQKRAFDRKFELLNYKATTGHFNFNYYFARWGILSSISVGKYLAGDIGYTFDISRRLSSGFRTGIFFSRTDVSKEIFGEGAFDKGFYFQIPIDLFLNDYRGGFINFRLRPLTRDGGQKLEAGNDLIGIMHSTSRSEIFRDWGAFND